MNRYKLHESAFDPAKRDAFWDFARSSKLDHTLTQDELSEMREVFSNDPIFDIIVKKTLESGKINIPLHPVTFDTPFANVFKQVYITIRKDIGIVEVRGMAGPKNPKMVQGTHIVDIPFTEFWK